MTLWFDVAPLYLFKKNIVMAFLLPEGLTFNKNRTSSIFLIFVLYPVLEKLVDVLNFTQVNRLMKINYISPMLKIHSSFFLLLFCMSKTFLCCYKTHSYFLTLSHSDNFFAMDSILN